MRPTTRFKFAIFYYTNPGEGDLRSLIKSLHVILSCNFSNPVVLFVLTLPVGMTRAGV